MTWLRAIAALGFGVFTGATLFLFPATLVGFRQFDDPAVSGRLATGMFDAYGPIAWIALIVAVICTIALKLRRADRAVLPTVAGLVAVACVAGWLLLMRPIIDAAGVERREGATETQREDANARFRLWHGVSMVAALASLVSGAVATMGATRVRD